MGERPLSANFRTLWREGKNDQFSLSTVGIRIRGDQLRGLPPSETQGWKNGGYFAPESLSRLSENSLGRTSAKTGSLALGGIPSVPEKGKGPPINNMSPYRDPD
jgi:hypothetical protein